MLFRNWQSYKTNGKLSIKKLQNFSGSVLWLQTDYCSLQMKSLSIPEFQAKIWSWPLTHCFTKQVRHWRNGWAWNRTKTYMALLCLAPCTGEQIHGGVLSILKELRLERLQSFVSTILHGGSRSGRLQETIVCKQPLCKWLHLMLFTAWRFRNQACIYSY